MNEHVHDLGKHRDFDRGDPPIGAQTVVGTKDDERMTGVTKLELGNEGNKSEWLLRLNDFTPLNEAQTIFVRRHPKNRRKSYAVNDLPV